MSFLWMLTGWLWSLTLLELKKGHIQIVEKPGCCRNPDMATATAPWRKLSSFILPLEKKSSLCAHALLSTEKKSSG